MKANIQRAFDRSATTYNAVANTQHDVGATLIARLPREHYANILDLGCGTGITTQQLARQMQGAALVAQDFSSASLLLATKACEGLNVACVQADFDQALCGDNPQLIFSNMALHWSANTLALFKRCYEKLAEGGVLAFTLPIEDTFHEIRPFVRVRDFESADAIVSQLTRAGFEIEAHFTQAHTLHYHDRLSALRAIKQTGATVVSDRNPQPLKKSDLRDATTLTYAIGYFIGRKPC